MSQDNTIDCPALHSRLPGYPYGDQVPRTVRMQKTVTPDPMMGAQLSSPEAKAGQIYNVWTNSYGAVVAVMDDGSRLGLRPDEFEVDTWYPASGEPVQAFKNCTDARAYIADLFKHRLRRHDFNQYITERLAGDFAYAFANWLVAEGHADPGEVKQLRAELDEWKKRCQYNADTAHDIGRERDSLRAQLAKAHAVLQQISDAGYLESEDYPRIAELTAGDADAPVTPAQANPYWPAASAEELANFRTWRKNRRSMDD